MRKNNRHLFEGLSISRQTELCQNWMNQWPTVFFTFKDVEGLNFQDAYGMLTALVAFLFQQYDFLLTSEQVNEYDRAAFYRIVNQKASLTEIKTSFLLLTRMLCAHYGKPIILLMDEYFGFTDTDVTQILQDAKLSEHMPAVKMSRVFQRTVMRRSGRSIHACTPKSWRMIMTRYCVMKFHFLRNGA
ncbi:hypothetical protein DWY84_04750 [Clostridium sp. AF27-2AA]|nr:hypothetical protein DWY84_04750 [Clostridium sp. AF27-2AA]